MTTVQGRVNGTARAVLDVDDLHVSYGSTEVVRGVSLSMNRGEKIGVVGESGSGKSTLALAILSLLPDGGGVTGGRVSVLGADMTLLTERERSSIRGRDISLVFQDPLSSLDPVKTIGAQIGEAIRRHHPRMRSAGVRNRAIELLHAVGVPDPASRLRQYSHEYSGGMRQRVLIAIAIANDPALLIADEPTTALDVTTQAQILDLLDKLVAERGISVMLITHDLGVVSEFCDRILVMYAGRIVESRDVRALFTFPAHPYSSALLDSLPLPGRNRSEPLEWIHGAPPSLSELPAGCTFAPRCRIAVDLCRTTLPEPHKIDRVGANWAECHRAEEALAGTATQRDTAEGDDDDIVRG